MPTILVATSDGLRTFDDRGREGDPELAGRRVGWIAPAGDERWAIIEDREVWHDDRTGWARVDALDGPAPTCLASMDGDRWIGTDEAYLVRLSDDGPVRVDAFDVAEGRDAWFTPWGGPPATRSMANWDDDAYVNVHVGGILRTGDRGATWTPTIEIEADVHQVTTAEGLVLAACAGGLAASADRGVTWTMRTEGLDRRYARAVAVCGDRVLLSTSAGPRGGKAAVWHAPLAGGSFVRSAPDDEGFGGNVDSHWLDALPDGSFAAFVTEAGSLLGSSDQGDTWAELATGLTGIGRILVLP